MAHNISTYAGRVAAWHALGTVTGKWMTWEEVQEVAALDYMVFINAAPNPLHLTEEQAQAIQEAMGRDLATRLTLELCQRFSAHQGRERQSTERECATDHP